MDRLRRQVGEVAAQERDRDLDGRVVQYPPKPPDEVADREPDRDTADDIDEEVPGGVEEREAAGHDRGDGEAVRDERGAVVDEALTLEQPDQAPGQSQPLRDRGCGGRIGGRDDRAEHEGLCPAQADHGVGDPRDNHHRHQHEPDREQPDRTHVRAQLAERGEVRAGVEQRRQDGHEHQVRPQGDRRDPGNESNRQAAEHEQDRVGDPDELRGREQDRPGGEQSGQQQLVTHAEAQDHVAGLHPPSLARLAC